MRVILDFEEPMADKVRDWCDSLHMPPEEFCKKAVERLVDPDPWEPAPRKEPEHGHPVHRD